MWKMEGIVSDNRVAHDVDDDADTAVADVEVVEGIRVPLVTHDAGHYCN